MNRLVHARFPSQPPNLFTIRTPKGLSKIRPEIATAKSTPKISITTWIVVELCAGSTPILCSINGSTAPRQILLKTINIKLAVTAIVSGKGVRNAAARRNPAKLRMELNATAIFTSRLKNCPCVFSFRVPSAIPRMTVISLLLRIIYIVYNSLITKERTCVRT